MSVVDDRGTTAYTYNNDGLTTKIDSPEGIVRYEYEPLTNRLTRTFTTDAAGDVLNDVNYTYDSLGRLKTVTVVERNDEPLATPEATSYSYDLVGNLIGVDLPNGIVTRYEYDDLSRLDVMTHYEPDGTPAELSDNDKIARYDYDVRADGHRTGGTETYYDSGSPETNPIGRVAWQLHETITRNHCCPTLDELLDQVYKWAEAHKKPFTCKPSTSEPTTNSPASATLVGRAYLVSFTMGNVALLGELTSRRVVWDGTPGILQ